MNAYYRLPAAECQGVLHFSLENDVWVCYNNCACGISSLVEHLLPKQDRRVRFPYPAPNQKTPESVGFRGFSLYINALRCFWKALRCEKTSRIYDCFRIMQTHFANKMLTACRDQGPNPAGGVIHGADRLLLQIKARSGRAVMHGRCALKTLFLMCVLYLVNRFRFRRPLALRTGRSAAGSILPRRRGAL